MPKIHQVITSTSTSSNDKIHKPSQKDKKVTFHQQIQADATIPKPIGNRNVVARVSVDDRVKAQATAVNAIVIDGAVKDFAINQGNQTYHPTNVTEKQDRAVKTPFGRDVLTTFFIDGKRMSEFSLKDTRTGEVREGYQEDGIMYVQPKGSEAPIRADDEMRTPRNIIVPLRGDPKFYQNRTPGAILSNSLSFSITKNGIVPK